MSCLNLRSELVFFHGAAAAHNGHVSRVPFAFQVFTNGSVNSEGGSKEEVRRGRRGRRRSVCLCWITSLKTFKKIIICECKGVVRKGNLVD